MFLNLNIEPKCCIFLLGVYYQFFVSANGEKGEGNTSTIVGHRIPTFGNSHHQTEHGEYFFYLLSNFVICYMDEFPEGQKTRHYINLAIFVR